MSSDAGFSNVHFVLHATLAAEVGEESFILAFVRVPVLSEQITLTDPRVSTVFRDLQRILFCRITFAVMVKEAVRAIGRPSGINAIATETQLTINVGTLIQSGCFRRR
jgi:hypothetical protein